MDGIPPPSAAAGAFDSFLHPGQEVFSNYLIAQTVETPAAPHPPSGSAPPPARRKPVPEDAYPVGLQEGLPEFNSSADRPRSREPPSSTRAAAPTPAVEYLPSLDEALPFEFSDLDRYPRGRSPTRRPLPIHRSGTASPESEEEGHNFTNGTPVHSRLSSEPVIPVSSSPPPLHKRAETMALHPPSKKPPPLHVDSGSRKMSSDGGRQPKTPGSKIGSFFGWKTTTSPGAESSSTEISDNGRSPPMVPTNVDVARANGARMGSLSAASSAAAVDSRVSQLEDELREISAELAGSIRREIELEDLVERLQSELGSDANRRTSDYFSDSGTSSIRYGPESGSRVEDVEKIKRAAEQERAQLKIELSQKWQEERSRRAKFESHVQILESQVQQLRREKVDASNLASKTKELEIALEDTRRKLAEERQLKDNFEDLLTAMRVELEQHRNERDHLRDEVIPHLQAQLGTSGPVSLEPDPEVTRLRRELEALKLENAALAHQQSRFNSIAEEDSRPTQRSLVGLSRSNSLARIPMRSSGSRSGSLSRSNSVSGRDRESRESLADRMKDVEAQRDALHQALKSLLERQAYQTRENEKRIRTLELELERALQPGSPRRLGYEREVRNLREEVNLLRQRADEALEQKWQCEKGLAGLKMDLDRAEQETSTLRMLLHEHEIDVPEHLVATREGLADVQATSSSLEAAYQQLQADREYAEANVPRSLEEEQRLAEQLKASVERTEALANQVRMQLETNGSLRNRLAEAISKGEREQQLSAARINDMQNKLKQLEDTLILAQQRSEEEMAKHEDEIRALKESHNAQLLRAKNGIRSPMLSPKPPASPFFGPRSPRLDKTTSGDGVPLNQAVQTSNLEMRVKELEKALRDADLEMEEVVGRMNMAQIEVAELQSDRDEALRQTRQLQAEILAEREKFKALMG